METVAVIVPGLLGSSLIRGGHYLWSENLRDNYTRLTQNPSLLNWHPRNPADNTELIEAFRIPLTGSLFQEVCIYRVLVTSLRLHHTYGVGNRLLPFSYDWRQPIERTARQLGEKISREYGIPCDNTGKQQLTDSYQFHLICHSMGALVARIAIYNQYIHPRNVATLIQVGPPLEGAPCAFSALYGEKGSQLLPYLGTFAWARHFLRWKNLGPLFQILAGALRTMPGVYELLPPRTNYVWITSQGAQRSLVNPLNETIIDPTIRASAINLHGQLRDSINMIRSEGIIAATVYCQFHREKTDMSYEAERIQLSSGAEIYKVNGIYASTAVGDGTVLETSATYSGNDSTIPRPVINAEHREMCCNSDVIQHIMALL